ncbi:membrane protein insertase YidC [Dongia sedimenti]|uniref:Membrane protein insertase YidC n=1 Tax=Dongia sedimenti TaxID=3064282 RepID=A0ABU0YSI5_9PROT|nr:membrane protein insertase YidC [Rhodospirillaceae bacterium R-7]
MSTARPAMDKKNLIITIVLSALIMVGWQYFYEMPRLKQQQALQAQQAAQQKVEQPQAAPNAPASAAPAGAGTAAPALRTRDEALAQSPRVAIDTPRLHGSIALKGGRLDDLVLKDYRETVDPASPQVVLLSPSGGPEGHFAEAGFTSADPNVKLPSYDTVWQSDGGTLSVDHPVTLSWDNGAGLIFKRTFSVDPNFLFTVAQTVENKGTSPVSVVPYSRVVEFGLPKNYAALAIREGLIAVLDGELRGGCIFCTHNDWDYPKIHEFAVENPGDAGIHKMDSQGGWIGITTKYWLVASVIPSDAKVSARAFYDPKLDSFQGDFTGQPQTVAPGAAASFTNQIFAGAKELSILADYRDRLNVPLLDRAIDFGAFWFVAKPLFIVLEKIYGVLKHLGSVGNFGVAILCLTVLVRLCLFPLANKSYASMNKMKLLQPKMAELKEKYGEDKQRMNTEMMALYKREKVNPAAGCLPILVQFPVFLALYKVLSVTIEMRHAHFFGWIKDLSAPDPTSILNLFGLLPWHANDLIHIPVIGGIIAFISIGVWPIVMGFTMWAQMRMNPTPPDPVQARMFALMPFIFTFMLAHNTVGLVIYWAWNNTLSILQQRYIMRKLEKANKAKDAKSNDKPLAPKKG